MRVPLLMTVLGGKKRAHLIFNGTNTSVNCGSNASLDDLHAAIITVEAWIFINAAAQSDWIVGKGKNIPPANGWHLFTTGGSVWFRVVDSTTATRQISIAEVVGAWSHVAGYYDDTGVRKTRIAVNGVWSTLSSALVNPIGSDAGENLAFGKYADAAINFFTGKMGWVRISNGDRYGGAAGTTFTPPSRLLTPAVDANTVGLWPLNEGTGVTANDLSANNNNGTISNGAWGR